MANASTIRRAYRKAADNSAIRRVRFIGDESTAVFHVAFALATAIDLDWEKIDDECRAELTDVAARVFRRLTTGNWSDERNAPPLAEACGWAGYTLR